MHIFACVLVWDYLKKKKNFLKIEFDNIFKLLIILNQLIKNQLIKKLNKLKINLANYLLKDVKKI